MLNKSGDVLRKRYSAKRVQHHPLLELHDGRLGSDVEQVKSADGQSQFTSSCGCHSSSAFAGKSPSHHISL